MMRAFVFSEIGSRPGPGVEMKRQYLHLGGASATLGTISASGLAPYPSGVEADAFARVGIEGNVQ